VILLLHQIMVELVHRYRTASGTAPPEPMLRCEVCEGVHG
jgi:hypothetical protein